MGFSPAMKFTASALSVGANILYSEDMQDRLIVANQLTLINPFKRSNIQ